jgi:hypothetical protein
VRGGLNKMWNCIKTEMKTIAKLKSIWIGFLILLLIPSYFLISNYQSIEYEVRNVASLINELKDYEEMGEEVDYSNIEVELGEMFHTYHPQMAINNSLGMLIGIGLLVFPIIFSLYIGNEYSRTRPIKAKLTYYTLKNVFLSKMLVIIILIISFIATYSAIHIVVSRVCWGKYIETYYSTLNFNLSNEPLPRSLSVISLTFLILFFYSFVSVLLAIISKNGIAGIITGVALNYVVLPYNFTPHNIFNDLINKTIYTSNSSPFSFVVSMKSKPLTTNVELMMIFLYLVLFTIILVTTGYKQKNG